MKVAIIHIGAHKTGSSSLQKFLYTNSSVLEQSSIYYPTFLCDTNKYSFYGHNYLAWFFCPPKRLSSYTSLSHLSELYEQFKIYTSQLDTCFLLLSSEAFSILNKSQISSFLDTLRYAGFNKFHVIKYVRRQDIMSAALYQTAVKNYRLGGVSERFEEWYEKHKFIFDFYTIVKQWELLGCDIVVKIYDRSLLKNSDIIDDFLEVLFLLTGKKVTNFSSESYEENVTLPDFVTLLLSKYNSIENAHKIRKILREVGEIIIKYNPSVPRYDFIPPSLKKKILDEFYQSNYYLCKEYIGLEYIKYFTVEHEDVNDLEWKKRFRYPGAPWVELLKNLQNIIEKLQRGG